MSSEIDCDLTLRIEDQTYDVRGIASGYSLRKPGARAPYYASRSTDGLIECTCGDYLHRQRKERRSCKHGAALVQLGLMPAAEITPESDSAQAP